MPRATNFADIIKIATVFIKATYTDSKELKRIRNDQSKCHLYLYFLITQMLMISGKTMAMSAELKDCATQFE